jgi:Ni2+-binding GTPase involved in maturation of urease and hydrogenase
MGMRPGLVRFVLLGGFLGAGKTTAIARLARMFQDLGARVGIITNDQADELVDTVTLEGQGFAVEQVAGACFCCHFDALIRSAAALEARSQPEVILAEPVGSCTDLVATVIRPLMKLYGDKFTLAPYGVLLKPEYARQILDEDAGTLQSDAAYIFRKQLEEADYIAVNKIDALTESEVDRLVELARKANPAVPVVPISAPTGQGFDRLMELIDGPGQVARRTLDLDYDRYARGEAEFGWLNCRIKVISVLLAFSLDDLLEEIASTLGAALSAGSEEIAHLKISGRNGSSLGLVNLVDRRQSGELSMPSGGQVHEAELTINARVAIDPAVLEQQVLGTVEEVCLRRGLRPEVQALRSFRPGRPVPVHRFVSMGVVSASS